MCSLILWHRAYGGYPIVVAANRDEKLSRASTPPFVWEGSPSVLAPRDDLRGGTWIGANSRPLLIGLTNRHAIPSRREGMKSRGFLPINGLGLAKAEEVADWMSGLDAREYNGVHLVAADPLKAFLCIGDGADGGKGFRIEPLGMGMHIVTNFGVGLTHPRAYRIRRKFSEEQMVHALARISTFVPLLDLHETPVHPWGEPLGPNGTCVDRPPEEDYGTKSSCFIRLNPGIDGRGRRWQWWNRERPAPETTYGVTRHPHVCAATFREIDPLPVDPGARLFLGDEETPA